MRKIPSETKIIQYKGKKISDSEADRRFGNNLSEPNHTFFFSLENGKVIDGNDQGNDSKWINHSCDPNCESREEKGKIFIYALKEIESGEELFYDYSLFIDQKITKAIKNAHKCECGSKNCRKTMLFKN